jgi:hypothetical protein
MACAFVHVGSGQHLALIVVTLVGTPYRPRSPQHLSMGLDTVRPRTGQR